MCIQWVVGVCPQLPDVLSPLFEIDLDKSPVTNVGLGRAVHGFRVDNQAHSLDISTRWRWAIFPSGHHLRRAVAFAASAARAAPGPLVDNRRLSSLHDPLPRRNHGTAVHTSPPM